MIQLSEGHVSMTDKKLLQIEKQIAAIKQQLMCGRVLLRNSIKTRKIKKADFTRLAIPKRTKAKQNM